jgi:hypothetical protein
MGPGFADYAVLLGQTGVADLALILVVLIVIWKGYVKKLRWTWFVMLIIVCGWAFPPLVLANRTHFEGSDLPSWAHLSIWNSIFLLMLVALILPVRSFFGKPREGADGTPLK